MNAVLLAFTVPDVPGKWYAWCPRCARFHIHSPEEGMRAPHCTDANGTKLDEQEDYRLIHAGTLTRRTVDAINRRAAHHGTSGGTASTRTHA